MMSRAMSMVLVAALLLGALVVVEAFDDRSSATTTGEAARGNVARGGALQQLAAQANSSLALVTNTTSASSTAVDGLGRRKLSTYDLMFEYTGSVQEWVVPAGVDTFAVDAYGAQGGDFYYRPGGRGGFISAVVTASSFVGKSLFIYVGTAGALHHSIAAPGLGGGGGLVDQNQVANGYTTGGGATDLRTSFSDLSSRCPSLCSCLCMIYSSLLAFSSHTHAFDIHTHEPTLCPFDNTQKKLTFHANTFTHKD